MRTIANLFGRSPFVPLRHHMEKVANCIHLLPELLESLLQGQYSRVEELSSTLQRMEREADSDKSDIRNHLPKTLFLPIDRVQLLEILSLQDHLADRARDVAVLCILKQLTLPSELWDELLLFLKKNIATFDLLFAIVQEMHELLESSFGGFEAKKVSKMVEDVVQAESEADLVQFQLLKHFFRFEEQLTLSSFYLWLQIFQAVSAISNISESLAHRVRMTLEVV